MLRRKSVGMLPSEQAAKQGSLVRQTQYRGDLPREGCQSSIGEEWSADANLLTVFLLRGRWNLDLFEGKCPNTPIGPQAVVSD